MGFWQGSCRPGEAPERNLRDQQVHRHERRRAERQSRQRRNSSSPWPACPPRDALHGQVVGTIAMPMRNLVGALSALPRNLVNVLDQIKKQKEAA
jgi:hypothetical protein